MNLNLRLSPNRITGFLLKIIAILLLANLLAIYFKDIKGWEHALGFNRMFDFDSEFNFPSLYSSLAIVFCGVLLLFIANNNAVGKGEKIYWKGLAALFFFLGLDELISIHEKFSIIMGVFFGGLTEATGNKVWFIPFGLILIVVALFFIKFLLRLPKKTLRAFVVSGIVFVTGAVLVELISGFVLVNTDSHVGYSLLYTIEELLEMLGIVLFIRALVYYILKYCPNSNFDLKASFIENKDSVAEGASDFNIADRFTMENASSYSSKNR